MPSYLSFARFYDGLMQDACYEKRCGYILELAEKFRHDMGITLDLACGTGTLTRLLKKRGVDVFGIDYSMEMLSEAMQSASEEGLDILFLRQKMQSCSLMAKKLPMIMNLQRTRKTWKCRLSLLSMAALLEESSL